MNEKMTDEAMGILTLRHTMNQAWTHDEQESVLAHIAALTAERDEVERHADAAAEQGREWLRERDALRERVTALEAESKVRLALANVWKGRSETAESRLDAIRQWVEGFADAVRAAVTHSERPRGGQQVSFYGDFVNVPPSQLSRLEWYVREARAALGDDSRPRAPPEAFTHEKGLDAGVFDEAPLNPDATSEADQSIPEVTLEIVGLAEPTISEAFAAVRGYVEAVALLLRRPEDREDQQRVRDALSLLERRMGEMEQALELALTDAPPVFTLEEVREAFSTRADMDDEANIRIFNAMVEALSALRK